MGPIAKFYYKATAYIPRRLPANEAEYERMKKVLIGAYGVPDDLSAWRTVAGQITSTEAIRIRKPWGHIANAAKRIFVNLVAHKQKTAAERELNAQLEAAFQKEQAEIEKKAQEAQTHDESPEAIEPETHAVPIPTPNQVETEPSQGLSPTP